MTKEKKEKGEKEKEDTGLRCNSWLVAPRLAATIFLTLIFFLRGEGLTLYPFSKFSVIFVAVVINSDEMGRDTMRTIRRTYFVQYISIFTFSI